MAPVAKAQKGEFRDLFEDLIRAGYVRARVDGAVVELRDQPALEEGTPANLTIFDAETEWTFEKEHIRSKSRNTPFVGAPMVGRAWAIYNHGQFVEADAEEAA